MGAGGRQMGSTVMNTNRGVVNLMKNENTTRIAGFYCGDSDGSFLNAFSALRNLDDIGRGKRLRRPVVAQNTDGRFVCQFSRGIAFSLSVYRCGFARVLPRGG